MRSSGSKKELISLVKSYARDMKILVVDDNRFDVKFYDVLFGKHFKVFDVAQNGKDAIELFKIKPKGYYDLITTDINMPVMDGLELVKEIRSYSLSQSVVVITGVNDLKVNQEIFYYIDGLLPKPVDSKRLYALLYKILKRVSDEKDFENYVSYLEESQTLSDFNIDKLNIAIKKLEYLKDVDGVSEALDALYELLEYNKISSETIGDYADSRDDEIEFIDDEFFDFESEDVGSAIERMHLADHEKITAKEFMSEGLIDSGTIDDIVDILEEFRNTAGCSDELNGEYLEHFEEVISSFITILNISYEFRDIAYGLEKLYTQTLIRGGIYKG